MSAGWVAGSVRARALAARRLGAGPARRLAARGSLRDAQRALDGTAYGRGIRPGQELAATQHEVAGALLWNLRVLAGWLPQDGVRLLRVLCAWFELANVDELLAALAGRAPEPEFRLGALATAWPRLRRAGSRDGLRAALASSDWRDPGGDTERALRLGLRARYAARAAALGDPVRAWAAGAMALLVAGEMAAGEPARPAAPAGTAFPGTAFPGTALPGTVLTDASSLLGPGALRAASLAELAGALPSGARWVLDGVSAPGELWRAEAAWRGRVERDGLRLLAGGGLDDQVVTGAVAVLACDAWRVRAALELAARGGAPLDAYDEVAGDALA